MSAMHDLAVLCRARDKEVAMLRKSLAERDFRLRQSKSELMGELTPHPVFPSGLRHRLCALCACCSMRA